MSRSYHEAMKLSCRPPGRISFLRRREDGQILVLATLLLATLVGMGALAVDVGFYLHEKQNVQNAVDAAALAGAGFLPDDGTGADAAARQYALANDAGLDPANINVSFRCLVGDRNGDGVPDPGDIPAACDPKTDASWFVKNGLAVSPCVPANTDKCNIIVVTASNKMKFFLAPALGIKQGDTGTLMSAACKGACGGPPSGPVDLVLVLDRTGSMSSSDLTNMRNATNDLLKLYDPSLQWVGLGLLGPSNASSSCSGVNSPAKGMGANSSQYATGNWVPVGLSGIGAPEPDAYVNAGVLNTSSLLVKAITCFNSSSTGTNLSTSMKKAKEYLLSGVGRPGVKKGIIFETDGSPNYGTGSIADYTCQASATAAAEAKAAGIEVFTIGFGVTSSDKCPDGTGSYPPSAAYNGKSVTKLLADNATTSTDDGCVPAENTDGDHFFCAPKTTDLSSIFQTVAAALSTGSHLVTLPQ